MIPKRLLLTHVSEHGLHPKLRYCIQQMKNLHPGWEFLFFSDGDCRDFIQSEAPEFMEMYDWYPKAVMRADLFRLLVVHRLGGFYLDTDMLLEQPMDALLEHTAVFAIEEKMTYSHLRYRFPRWMWKFEGRWSLANYAFAAEKGHPFVGEILDEVIARTADFSTEDPSSLDILHSTGPDAVTTAYYGNLGDRGNVKILEEEGCRFGIFGKHLVHSIWWDGV